MIRLVAVNAGLGEPSSTRMLVDRLVSAVTGVLGENRVQTTTIDLRDLAVDLGRSMAAGFATGAARAAIDTVQGADALIVATPVFNASYSGLFKTFFDLVDVDEMAATPVLIAATGGSPRHSMVLDHALRPLFGYLRMIVVPTGVYAAAEDWAGGSGDTTTLGDRIDRAARELAALLESGKQQSRAFADALSDNDSQNDTAAESAGIANFARLLGGSG
ncbi:putative NADH-dependent FMN reductase [Gordonia polyisoprenivorans VH2]|uniref:Putative NADH-dependent FMN reductase n=1 Tax=Gordonia polyisoprenivorans (strain DSM 44266 / VH2) TaxID=1112204 RepID=H6N1S6_GORPV|nr:CE1759 family FMN reductase [Gordonia polyisoprenivorans]AFA74596.1 putative NADH-dependent FMN reductase [Gordonia polyisoprenivorans VH2]OZC31593.1 oxidoreductase [Gordonia polyisoprenivorans]QUD84030.1 NAD(P)H-dependent oxidoreductase [Gordonia polyisoprenivorans]UZF54957.1 NAD(P)H-dependent oxidoreductase [Gordonia polyisoprenivorans]